MAGYGEPDDSVIDCVMALNETPKSSTLVTKCDVSSFNNSNNRRH